MLTITATEDILMHPHMYKQTSSALNFQIGQTFQHFHERPWFTARDIWHALFEPIWFQRADLRRQDNRTSSPYRLDRSSRIASVNVI